MPRRYAIATRHAFGAAAAMLMLILSYATRFSPKITPLPPADAAAFADAFSLMPRRFALIC